MTKTLAAHVKDMASVAKAMSTLDPKGMAADIGIPFHPGAAKFYKENGIDVKVH
jgi:TRAP-type uncharacterized transport system substrate-binding protein